MSILSRVRHICTYEWDDFSYVAVLALIVLLAVLSGVRTQAAPLRSPGIGSDPEIHHITMASDLPCYDPTGGDGITKTVYFSNSAAGTITMTFDISGTPTLTLTAGAAFNEPERVYASRVTPSTFAVIYSVSTTHASQPNIAYTATNANSAQTKVAITYVRDTTAPLISSPVITEYSDYLYAVGIHLFYTNTMPMGEKHNFWIGGAASDGGSGLAWATFSPAFGDTPLEDMTPAAWETRYDVYRDNLDNGVIAVTVYDKAGNISTQIYTYALDGTPPTSAVTAPVESFGKAPIEIEWDAEDDGCGVKTVVLYYRRTADEDWEPFGDVGTAPTGTFDFVPPTVLITGPITYEFASAATDHLGNSEGLPGKADTTVVVQPARLYLPLVVRNYPPCPVGSVVIEGGADHVYYITVTLTLSATFEGDVDTVDEMRLRNDGEDWGAWEPYTTTPTTKAWLLRDDPGPRTVYVQFKGAKGGISEFADTIELREPSGSVTIEGGAATVYQPDVELALSVEGDWAVRKMCISNSPDCSNWITFTEQINWPLAGGTKGLRAVYAQFRGSKGESCSTSDQVYFFPNGNFEYGAIQPGWQKVENPLPVSIVQSVQERPSGSTPPADGSYAVLLGKTDYPCASNGVPLGYAAVEQTFHLPSKVEGLTFKYIIWSQDASTSNQYDRFEVYVNGELKFYDGNQVNTGLSCSNWWRVPGPDNPRGGRTDGWATGEIDLSAYAGQNVTISFRNYSRYDGWYNTYTYIDSVTIEGDW